MSKATRSRHTRKKRRQHKMTQRSGGKFKVGHKGKSGRTGNMHSKMTPKSYRLNESGDPRG